jgi:hypothetical protein
VKRLWLLATVLVCGLVFSSSALADSLHCAHGSACGSGSPAAGVGAGNGTLPFTGLGLGGIAVVGGLLLITGVVLAKGAGRRKQQ